MDPPTERWSGGRRWRPEGDDEPAVSRRRDDRRRSRRTADADEPRYAPPPALLAPVDSSPVARACGRCRNFRLSDIPGGRGECDHPGSGFMYPYTDTPACPFYQAR